MRSVRSHYDQCASVATKLFRHSQHLGFCHASLRSWRSDQFQTWFKCSPKVCVALLDSRTNTELFDSHVRTSEGGNGKHSVSLPIILIKIKVDQMLPSSYISSLLVSILLFCIWIPISINVLLYFWAKMVTFCIIHIGNRKIFSKHHFPESQLILLHVSVVSYFT